jgi:hypothetical protein
MAPLLAPLLAPLNKVPVVPKFLNFPLNYGTRIARENPPNSPTPFHPHSQVICPRALSNIKNYFFFLLNQAKAAKRTNKHSIVNTINAI